MENGDTVVLHSPQSYELPELQNGLAVKGV